MTRFTAPSDSYAAALARVWAAGSGYALGPIACGPGEVVAGGECIGQGCWGVWAKPSWWGTGGRRIECPLPAPGESFFVGEAGYFHYLGGIRIYRADGTPRPSGVRWVPARQMPEYAARSRFEVASRRAIREMEITEDIAAKCGLPTANFEGHISYLGRSDKGPDGWKYAHAALVSWWETWFGKPREGRVWVVEVTAVSTQT